MHSEILHCLSNFPAMALSIHFCLAVVEGHGVKARVEGGGCACQGAVTEQSSPKREHCFLYPQARGVFEPPESSGKHIKSLQLVEGVASQQTIKDNEGASGLEAVIGVQRGVLDRLLGCVQEQTRLYVTPECV